MLAGYFHYCAPVAHTHKQSFMRSPSLRCGLHDFRTLLWNSHMKMGLICQNRVLQRNQANNEVINTLQLCNGIHPLVLVQLVPSTLQALLVAVCQHFPEMTGERHDFHVRERMPCLPNKVAHCVSVDERLEGTQCPVPCYTSLPLLKQPRGHAASMLTIQFSQSKGIQPNIY